MKKSLMLNNTVLVQDSQNFSPLIFIDLMDSLLNQIYFIFITYKPKQFFLIFVLMKYLLFSFYFLLLLNLKI